jgi:hypothetical protein
LFSRLKPDRFLAVRLDLHPVEWLAGHVRVARSRPGQLPQRLTSVEERLERQILNEALIEAAVMGEEALTREEQAELSRMFPLQ